jgi:hypothetical protein
MAPVAPEVAAEVAIAMSPLEADVLVPDIMATLPPVVPVSMVAPADIIKTPPEPEVPLPTVI